METRQSGPALMCVKQSQGSLKWPVFKIVAPGVNIGPMSRTIFAPHQGHIMDATCFQEAVRANICELCVGSIGEIAGAEIALSAWNGARTPKSGCLGRARSEGPHSLDEGVDLRIGPDGDAAPVLVRWKTPSDSDIPMPHELGELLDRHARVKEYEISMRLGIRKVQSRQFGGQAGSAGQNPPSAVCQELLITEARNGAAHSEYVGRRHARSGDFLDDLGSGDPVAAPNPGHAVELGECPQHDDTLWPRDQADRRECALDEFYIGLIDD